jgi:hypothetical protein
MLIAISSELPCRHGKLSLLDLLEIGFVEDGELKISLGHRRFMAPHLGVASHPSMDIGSVEIRIG